MRTLERWKSISEFPNYEVSNLGNIRHKKNRKVLKQSKHKNRYSMISFRKGGKQYCRYIHRLVLFAFFGYEEGMECNHVDGDKTNNKINNIEWCTKSDNLKHAHSIGLRSSKGENNGFSKLKKGEVWLIRKLWDSGKSTQTFIASMFHVAISTVNYIVTGKTWQAEER